MKNHLMLSEIDPPKELQTAIFERIEKKIEKRNLYRKITGFSLLPISFFTSVWLLIYTANEFQKSGFGTYLSLAFTDSKIVLSNFREYALSLVDSLPFFALTVSLLSIIAVFLLVQYAVSLRRELSYTN